VLRQQLVDLASALVGGGGEEPPMAGVGQLRREEVHGGEVHEAPGEQVQDEGMFPRRPRRLDAVVGLVLGKSQDLAAVREERGEPGAQVELASIELDQVSDEMGRCLTLSTGKGRHVGYELSIREMGWDVDLHDHVISRAFSESFPG
jgi:hypothetical protein